MKGQPNDKENASVTHHSHETQASSLQKGHIYKTLASYTKRPLYIESLKLEANHDSQHLARKDFCSMSSRIANGKELIIELL